MARASALGARMLTVHASGGPAMLRRAVERARHRRRGPRDRGGDGAHVARRAGPRRRSASRATSSSQVERLARLAWAEGVRALRVLAPRGGDASAAALGPEATLVTPGVRPAGGGQRRPEAHDDGGRGHRAAAPTGSSSDAPSATRPIPLAAARAIASEVASASRRGARRERTRWCAGCSPCARPSARTGAKLERVLVEAGRASRRPSSTRSRGSRATTGRASSGRRAAELDRIARGACATRARSRSRRSCASRRSQERAARRRGARRRARRGAGPAELRRRHPLRRRDGGDGRHVARAPLGAALGGDVPRVGGRGRARDAVPRQRRCRRRSRRCARGASTVVGLDMDGRPSPSIAWTSRGPWCSSSAPRARGCARRSSACATRSRASRCRARSRRSTRRSPSRSRSTRRAPAGRAVSAPAGAAEGAATRSVVGASTSSRCSAGRSTSTIWCCSGFLMDPVARDLDLSPTSKAWLLGVALGASGLGGIVGGRAGRPRRQAHDARVDGARLLARVARLRPRARGRGCSSLGRAIVGLGVGRRVGHRARDARRVGRARSAAGAGRRRSSRASPSASRSRRSSGTSSCRAVGWRVGADRVERHRAHRARRAPLGAPARRARGARRAAAAPARARAGSAGASAAAWLLGVFKLGTYWTCYTWLPVVPRARDAPGGRALAHVDAHGADRASCSGMLDVRRRLGPPRAAPRVHGLLGASRRAPSPRSPSPGESLSPALRSSGRRCSSLGFGSGCTAGFGALLAELFPTEVRGVAMGTTYNLARAAQLLAPVVVQAAVLARRARGRPQRAARARPGDRVVGVGPARDARDRPADPRTRAWDLGVSHAPAASLAQSREARTSDSRGTGGHDWTK